MSIDSAGNFVCGEAGGMRTIPVWTEEYPQGLCKAAQPASQPQARRRWRRGLDKKICSASNAFSPLARLSRPCQFIHAPHPTVLPLHFILSFLTTQSTGLALAVHSQVSKPSLIVFLLTVYHSDSLSRYFSITFGSQ